MARHDEPPSFLSAGLEMIAKRAPTISKETRRRYENVLRQLFDIEVFAGNDSVFPFKKRVDEITEDDILLWINQTSWSPKTQSHAHALLAGVFKYAVAQDWIAASPASRATGVGRRVAVRFTFEQQGAMLYCHTGTDTVQVTPQQIYQLGRTHGNAARHRLFKLWLADADDA
jgi:hypothetical protein